MEIDAGSDLNEITRIKLVPLLNSDVHFSNVSTLLTCSLPLPFSPLAWICGLMRLFAAGIGDTTNKGYK